MIEQCKTAYSESRRVRMFVGLGLCVLGVLLYACSDGFPPWAWRFLAHVLAQLPQLWTSQGSAIVIPLIGLVLLSFSLLILWLLLLFAVYKVVFYWWHHLHEHEHFAMDLRDAERLSDEEVSKEDDAWKKERERWQPAAPTQPAPPQPVQAQQRAYPVARASRVIGSSGLIRVPSAAFSDETPFPTVAPSRPKPPSVATQPAAHIPLESRTMPMSVPTKAIPRVPLEANRQVPLSMQTTQPIAHQAGGRAVPLATPPAPRPMTMREQLHIVPRITEEPDDMGDTMPFLPDTRDIVTHDTLPDQDLVEVDEIDDDDAAYDEDEDTGDGNEYSEDEEIIDEDVPTRKGMALLEDTLTDAETFPANEPLRLLVGIGLDTGITRKDAPNEDNLFAIQGMRPTNAGPEPVGLFIIADGMGGHAHGQEASKLAVHAISDAIVPTLMRQVDDDEIFLDLLKDGVHRANLAIYQRNRAQEHMMGTTLTAVLVVASIAYIVNVGDSRTYLYRSTEEGIEQVTRDHSVVARLVEDGMISREELYTHPKRNQIYRCLGERATVEVDTFVRELQADDVLVLCSDGLWEMVHDDEIEHIVASSRSYPSQMSKMLIQAALMRGGADNISVIVACMAQTDAM